MSHAAEFDAHGHKDHGHVIVSSATLRLVLLALLFFTLLTVGAAQFEGWISEVFNVAIPNWFNVAVCLTIASIKTILVVLFFMQLKFDNPLNSMIFIFTIVTVAFFLGFTMLDLGNRDTLDPIKARYVQEGGMGLGNTYVAKGSVDEGQTIPITVAAVLAAKAKGTFDPSRAHHDERGPRLRIIDSGFVAREPKVGSSSNLSRPVQGVTIPGLPGYKPPQTGHGDEVGEHKAEGAAPAGEAQPADAAKTPESKPETKPATKPEAPKH